MSSYFRQWLPAMVDGCGVGMLQLEQADVENCGIPSKERNVLSLR